MSVIAASRANDVETLKRLIEGGADLNVVDEEGCTALLRALSRHHLECVRALIDGKADVNKGTEEGWTPLHTASLYGQVECAGVSRSFCVRVGFE